MQKLQQFYPMILFCKKNISYNETSQGIQNDCQQETNGGIPHFFQDETRQTSNQSGFQEWSFWQKLLKMRSINTEMKHLEWLYY